MIRDYVRLASVYHLLSTVRVAVLKDLDSVRTEAGWESFIRGDEAGIPLWQAAALSRRGYVELREQPLTDGDVAKYLMIERGLKGGEFHRLRERFYFEVRDLLRRARENAKSSPEGMLKVIKLESNVTDLVRVRLRKIVQIAFLGGKPEDFIDSLLMEERALFMVMKDLIDSWEGEVTRSE